MVSGLDLDLVIRRLTDCTVVWVPDVNLLDVPHDSHERPDQILRSVEEFVPEEWGLPPYSATPPATSSA